MSEMQDLLAPGHRGCAGCPASICVRQVLDAAGPNTICTNATGCLEVMTTPYPETAWRVPWIHSAFENSAAMASGIEAAVKALNRRNGTNKKPNIIAFAGDGGTFDIGLQALSGALERGHRMLFVCYDNEAYMNCLSLSSLILTKEGLKKITDVNVGDEIYAFDQKNRDLVLKKCTGIFDNGVKDVYELETLHHSIKATGNHPFLVLKRNGRGKENVLVWKTLEELKTGEEVVVLKNMDDGKSYRFDFEKVEKGDYKVHRLNDVNIPESSSPELMKYLGLYVGDGWIRAEKGEVGFALPEGTDGRKALIDIHLKLFGGNTRTDDVYVYANSVNLARFIDSLGFGDGARNKIIPSWLFTLPRAEKESFVEGLMLSDGYKAGNSWRYVSASHELLRTLRLFLQTMGHRVGKIHKQTKKKGTRCVERELLKDSEYGYVCFSRRREWDIERHPSQYKYQNFLIGNKYFEMEKIRKITLIGKEPTLDLRVEGEHNFIADGMVVHNTGIQRCSSTPIGAWTTTSPEGSCSFGKTQRKKPIAMIAAAHDIPYVATACISYPQDLKAKVKKALACDGPSFLHVFAPCPTGWRFASDKTIAMGKLAVETGVFVLYEMTDADPMKPVVTYKPKEFKPVEEYLKAQGRFAHLFKPARDEAALKRIQEDVDRKLKWVGLKQ